MFADQGWHFGRDDFPDPDEMVGASFDQMQDIAGDAPIDDLADTYYLSMISTHALRSLARTLQWNGSGEDVVASVAAFVCYAAAVEPLERLVNRASFELLAARNKPYRWRGITFRCAAKAIAAFVGLAARVLKEKCVIAKNIRPVCIQPARLAEAPLRPDCEYLLTIESARSQAFRQTRQLLLGGEESERTIVLKVSEDEKSYIEGLFAAGKEFARAYSFTT